MLLIITGKPLLNVEPIVTRSQTSWLLLEHTDTGGVVFRWCGPCKILGPRLEKAIAKQKGRVAMAKVDIDDHTDLAIEYGVSYSKVFFWHR